MICHIISEVLLIIGMRGYCIIFMTIFKMYLFIRFHVSCYYLYMFVFNQLNDLYQYLH